MKTAASISTSRLSASFAFTFGNLDDRPWERFFTFHCRSERVSEWILWLLSHANQGERQAFAGLCTPTDVTTDRSGQTSVLHSNFIQNFNTHAGNWYSAHTKFNYKVFASLNYRLVHILLWFALVRAWSAAIYSIGVKLIKTLFALRRLFPVACSLS